MARKFVSSLSKVFGEVHRNFSRKEKRREEMLRLCREVIRLSSESIRWLHRQQTEKAEKVLERARQRIHKLAQLREKEPELYFSGTVHDSQKEWVEASLMYAFLHGEECPAPRELNVEDAAFLKGVGEAVGELRRYVLDRLRQDGTIAEKVLEVMDEIHAELMKFDFPEALTLGLRRLSDQTRVLTEKTRGDVTLAKALRGER